MDPGDYFSSLLDPGDRPDGLRPLVEEMERLRAGAAIADPSAGEQRDAYSWLELAEGLVAEGWSSRQATK